MTSNSFTEREHELIRTTAKVTVEEALIVIGVDAKNPLEMQKDHAYLRRARRVQERLSVAYRATGLAAILSTVAGGLAYLLGMDQ